MASTIWVLRKSGNPLMRPGSVCEIVDGHNVPHGMHPTQSDQWRVVLVDDASADQLRARNLMVLVENPAIPMGEAKAAILTHRQVLVDIERLESLVAAKMGRPLAPSDSIRVPVSVLDSHLVRPNVPRVPGLI